MARMLVRGRAASAPCRVAAAVLLLGVLHAEPAQAQEAAGDQILPSQSLLQQKGASLHSVEWRQHEIPVCWIDPAPEDGGKRAIVREAVRDTWEAAADVRLVSWRSCNDSGGPALMVRIRVGDAEWPRAIVGNNALSRGAPTVFLNFNLVQRPGFAGCRGREERCLRFTAVHEFGHVLGLIHEQDRPETPAQCIAGLAPGQRQTRNATDLDLLTGYDPDSLMNYCSSRGFDPRVPLLLSVEDRAAIAKLFGSRRSAEAGTAADPAGDTTPASHGDTDGGDAGKRRERKQDNPVFDPN